MKKRLTEVQFKKIIGELKVGRRTIDIARGVLVEGKPAEVARDPRVVAAYLGSADGAVSKGGGGHAAG